MRTSDFNFDLPPELIAQYPLQNRTDSRLLCLIDGQLSHKQFTDFPSLINPGDLLVFNNTRVIPARMHLHKSTGGKVEILLERVLDDKRFLAHLKASKGAKIGTKLYSDPVIASGANQSSIMNYSRENWLATSTPDPRDEGKDAIFEVVGRHDDLFEIQNITKQPLLELFTKHGHIPLPPYITRSDEQSDQERYQTVYAKEAGAVAAPTAGLHFDNKILEVLKAKGVEFAFVTLHVGAGTFQPVRVENIAEHKMHAEYLEVSEEVCQQINTAKAAGKRIIAIGTTSVRCLETVARTGQIQSYYGDTDIFIYPGYQFKCVDALLTNFHLPESTLLMLVSSFAGYEPVMRAYQVAVAEKYRFFSYGDAMFLSRLDAETRREL